jgi:SNF2 family DNA or RNA helicase
MNFAFLHHESTHNSYLTETHKDFLKYFGHINKTYVESLDVILISDTQYNHMALFFTRDNYTVNRIIVDECNSIKGSQLAKIESVFKWFITSSISSIMTCDGWLKKEITSPQGYSSYTREKSIMSTGFIFDNISEIYRNIKENFKIFLINNPEYIEQSTQLPEMLTYIIICKNNVSIQVLAGIVSHDIMNMLFAGDIDGIVSKLDVVVGDETNIIAMVTQKYKDELNCKEYELKTSLANPKYKADAETIGVINRRHAIADLKHKIACIEERVKTVESCPICFDDFTNPCITPCCNNKFCFDCMTMSLNNKNSCPSCRAELSVAKLMLLSNKKKEIGVNVVVTKEIEVDPSTMTYPQRIELLKTKSIDLTKYENMDKIFELNSKNEVKKYLIFTEYESTLNIKITSMLDKWGLTYGRIKGTTATITKQIENYKKGNTNVLLINSKFFGSGMNLENTSDIIIIHKMHGDIEMQAIGRAHRFGRLGNLRVWKLYYENEK